LGQECGRRFFGGFLPKKLVLGRRGPFVHSAIFLFFHLAGGKNAKIQKKSRGKITEKQKVVS
jgi:hypothetical protein